VCGFPPTYAGVAFLTLERWELMENEKQLKEKLRIAQRKDGVIFTWQSAFDTHQDKRAGWLYIYEDGSRTVTLDVAASRDLDASTFSQREQKLIEENAQLRDGLAQAQGLAPLGEQEIPLPTDPSMGPEFVNLTQPSPVDEEPIQFAERQFCTPSTLQTMRKVDLVSHARSFQDDADVSSDMRKDDLITLCLALQEKAVGE